MVNVFDDRLQQQQGSAEAAERRVAMDTVVMETDSLQSASATAAAVLNGRAVYTDKPSRRPNGLAGDRLHNSRGASTQLRERSDRTVATYAGRVDAPLASHNRVNLELLVHDATRCTTGCSE